MTTGPLEIVTRPSRGPLDTPWGADLRKIEQRVRDADEAGLLARWESGRHLLKLRKGKQLPHGVLGQASDVLGVSRSELNYRMQFAERCATADEALAAWRKHGSWRRVRSNKVSTAGGHLQNGGRPPSCTRVTRILSDLAPFRASDLEDAHIQALRELAAEIERILSEIE